METKPNSAGKRCVILTVLILLVSVSFWSGSRYPDIVQKGEAGPSLILDGIGFDSVYLVAPDDPTSTKVLKRTVNWLDTNKKGMTFGLVLAALAATLLSQLPRKGFSSVLGNTALGTFLGAPMGLCVNCAAPFGSGLHQSGSRLETSTAAVLASPTLNVLILSILFTMLPWHLAALKLAFTLLLILVGVPLLTRGVDHGLDGEVALCEAERTEQTSENWLTALLWSLKESLKNLWSLTLKVGPLMLVAGFLGSLLITLVPLEQLAEFKAASLGGLIGVSLVGTLLPVPVAFDVILCGLLYQGGVPSAYIAVLLVTLGSFSIYSYFVFRQTISRVVAFRVIACVFFLGVVAGLIAQPIEKQYRRYTDQQLLLALKRVLGQPHSRPRYPVSARSFFSKQDIQRKVQDLPWEPVTESDEYILEKRSYRSSAANAGPLFVQKPGPEFGLAQDFALSFREHLWVPTITNRSMAAADIHRDGWTDLVVANDTEFGGMTLYANVNGRFEAQSLPLPDEPPVFVLATALVDLNSDGWPDLYWSDILGRNRCLLNDHGEFSRLVELPTLPGAFVNSVGFGDLNNDGKLDLVAGTWVYRSARERAYRGWNYVLLQTGDLEFQPEALSGLGGNTHSVLLSDLNLDGKLDLIAGNDWTQPDDFYWGRGDGTFQFMAPGTVPLSTEWTMSLDTADLDNDLVQELFIAHIAYDNDPRRRMSMARKQNQEDLVTTEELKALRYMLHTDTLHDMNRMQHTPTGCLNSDQIRPEELSDCLFDTVLQRSWRGETREVWLDLVPEDDAVLRRLFDQVYPPPDEPVPTRKSSHISDVPSSKTKNVLYKILPGSVFKEIADGWGLDYTYWSWNARFADFNLDGFLDLYVVNGSYQEELLTPNLLYLNQQGKTLLRADDQGAADYFPTSNSCYFDLDNDGDLDIVTSPPNGEMRVFENQVGGRNALTIELEDKRSVIGSRLYLRSQGTQQMREIKLSGGFNSFDPLSQTFGATEPQSLRVVWPDGKTTKLAEKLEPGFSYRLTRKVK